MNADTVVLSRRSYDALKAKQITLEEILSEKRKPVGFIYSGHINCSNDVIYQTDNQLVQTVITANKVMALKMSKHEMMDNRVFTEIPTISSKVVATTAFIAGALVATCIFTII